MRRISSGDLIVLSGLKRSALGSESELGTWPPLLKGATCPKCQSAPSASTSTLLVLSPEAVRNSGSFALTSSRLEVIVNEPCAGAVPTSLVTGKPASSHFERHP